MNSLFIHLSGYLSAEMGSELYLKIKDTSQTPTLICLDCSLLTSMDSVGAEYLKKISDRMKATGSKLALCGCQTQFQKSLSEHKVEHLFPTFLSEIEAKSYLESQSIPTQPANKGEIPNTDENPVVTATHRTAKTVYCPVCDQSLQFTVSGDYLCPNCRNKFFVNKQGWASLYEKLV